MKFLDTTGLAYFWGKIKTAIAEASGTPITNAEIDAITDAD